MKGPNIRHTIDLMGPATGLALQVGIKDYRPPWLYDSGSTYLLTNADK